jgi:hypothetical protein
MSCATRGQVQTDGRASARVFDREAFIKARGIQLKEVCSIGASVISAQGTAWLKVRRGDRAMQFPAVLKAAVPNHLFLEVMNPLGGVEATIKVEGKVFEVQSARESSGEPRQGQDSWNGIPLRFASVMALGRIPCPPLSEAEPVLPSRDESTQVSNDDSTSELIQYRVPATVEHPEEHFEYQITKVSGNVWPKRLRWTTGDRHNPTVGVTLNFEEAEEGTLSPLIWEAESPQGGLKFKWRKRDLKKSG